MIAQTGEGVREGQRHSAGVQNISAGSYSDTSSKDNHRPDRAGTKPPPQPVRTGSHGPGALGTSLHRGSAPETAPSRFLVEGPYSSPVGEG